MSEQRIELMQRIDCLKTNWYIWSCVKDGVIGSVQADYEGELIAEETFEPEDEL